MYLPTTINGSRVLTFHDYQDVKFDEHPRNKSAKEIARHEKVISMRKQMKENVSNAANRFGQRVKEEVIKYGQDVYNIGEKIVSDVAHTLQEANQETQRNNEVAKSRRALKVH